MEFGFGAVISVVGGAIKHGKSIVGVVTKAYVRICDTDIVVTGASGAGKSHLIDYIASEIKQHRQTPQETSATVEHTVIPLNDDWFQKKISVIPGQSTKARDKAFVDLISKNNDLKGIVHVVDWGYTLPKSKDTEAYYKARNIKTLDELRSDNLSEEVEYLNSLADELELRPQKVSWFIIALNKVDLFDVGQAVNYYQNDPKFCNALSRVLARVEHISNPRNQIQPICCLREDFIFNGKTTKTRLASDAVQKQHYDDFRKTIEMQLAE
ncbi:GTPase [Enterobacter cloacae]|jgi:signal recognition particle receptor subunit beta|uniref:G domain-containing protein n=1 Tax=Enterobacter cloacae TaxID=550 RepID=A0A3R8ZYI5_ENTCL|nr:GTPase [Enterobacter cloacae]RSB30801.1 hypothetical protein EGK68_11050 [Enterobacter cloacae]